MSKVNRRDFFKSAILSSAALSVSGMFNCAAGGRVIGANDEIRVGCIGIRSKGAQHVDVFHELPNVRIVSLCDVDEEILNKQAKKFKDRGETVATFKDARHILDDKNIDVVVIGTPNHWHSLLGIWACQAGKDVYVEKPVSHNIWEGRKLVEAARKYNRIVQAGTQNRSDTGLREVATYLQEGNLGKVLFAHGLWFKERKSIGKVNGPKHIPSTIDYNLWTGPAPLQPLMRKRLHYDWHWNWTTGNGDMGNLGVHQIDDCRFLLGLKDLPKRVMSYGGRFVRDDDAVTPNAQFTFYDYESVPVFIEIRNLPMKKGVRAMDHLRGVRMGNIIQCENGYFAGGRGGGWVYDNNKKKIKQFPGDGGGLHQANFIAAVRSRNAESLHAEVEEGHMSSVLCHMANISYRLGKRVSTEKINGKLQNNQQAQETLEKIQKHLVNNEVDLEKTPLTRGPWLTMDKVKEQFVGDFSYEANMFIKPLYRKPFVVPEVV